MRQALGGAPTPGTSSGLSSPGRTRSAAGAVALPPVIGSGARATGSSAIVQVSVPVPVLAIVSGRLAVSSGASVLDRLSGVTSMFGTSTVTVAVSLAVAETGSTSWKRIARPSVITGWLNEYCRAVVPSLLIPTVAEAPKSYVALPKSVSRYWKRMSLLPSKKITSKVAAPTLL